MTFLPTIDQPSSRWMKPAWAAHLLLIGGAMVWLLVNNNGKEALSVRTIGVWTVALGLLGLAPRWPAIGPVLYAALSCLIHRYEPILDPPPVIPEYNFGLVFDFVERPLNIDMLGIFAALSVTGCLAWWLGRADRPSLLRARGPRHWLAWVMTLLVLWILITWGLTLRTNLAPPPLDHHPRAFLEGAAMFLVASMTLGAPLEALTLSLGVVVAIILRGRILAPPSGNYRQEDIAGLIAMSIPLACMVIVSAPEGVAALRLRSRDTENNLIWGLRIGCALMALYLLRMAIGTQNRAVVVALAVVALVLWLTERHKIISLAIAVPVLIAGLLYMRHSELWKRFSDIQHNGPEAGSVFERVDIWRTGIKMFLDHPVTGVGPGRFGQFVDQYDQHFVNQYHHHLNILISAHNNFIAMLTETGVPGLLLYVALYFGALFVLLRLWLLLPRDWPGPAARMLIAALCGYLVMGQFITRHDLPLAYLLAGWALALRRRVFGSGADAATA